MMSTLFSTMSKLKQALTRVIARSAATKQSQKEETMSKVKQALESKPAPAKTGVTKEGLPREAFAIVGDPDKPETWKLPHHTKAISAFQSLRKQGIQGRLDIEKTVDWDRMPTAVASLSRGGYRGERVQADPEEIISAARHLARHYEKANKPVPDTLGALI